MCRIPAIAVAALVAASCLPGIPAWGQGDDATPTQLDELVVTAGKRPQNLADFDGTITVVTREDLEAANVTKVADLERVFPGLIVRSRGNRAYANVTLRGVTSPDFYNPAVQIYVDGVPQDPAYFTQSLLNVERVELLRGPQGTLYGRNAHGGVINIVSNLPGPEFAGQAAGQLATGLYDAEAGIGGPIVKDRLYGDVWLRWSQEPGEITDLSTGNKIGASRTDAGQARLRFAPVGGPLDVTAAVRREALRSHEELYIREALVEDRAFDSRTQGGEPLVDRTVTTASLNASYDFGGQILTSITSYQDRSMTRLLQGRDTPEDQVSLSEEVRLAFGADQPLSGLLGAFAQDTRFKRSDPGFVAFFGPSLNEVRNRSYALFGETTYRITDRWDVTGGLRWSREDARISYARSAPAGFGFDGSDSFTDISPKLAMGYEIAPGHRLYAVASRGFKPGGFNHTVSVPADSQAYRSETSTNFEIGWRGNLLDGLADFTLDAYWIQAKDKQIYVGPLGAQVLRNAGSADSRGVELDLHLYPTDRLTLRVGATYGRATFRDATDPQTGASYDGNRLPYAPDTTLQLAAAFLVPQRVVPGDLSVRGEARYFSRMYFNETNSLSQPAYTLFSAAIDLVVSPDLSLSLFAENITDKTYRTSSFAFGPNDVRSTLGDGRSIGIAGRMAF